MNTGQWFGILVALGLLSFLIMVILDLQNSALPTFIPFGIVFFCSLVGLIYITVRRSSGPDEPSES